MSSSLRHWLIALPDAAREIGLRVKVRDEGKYAQLRDVAELELEVAAWNELIAGFVGRLKDTMEQLKGTMPGESIAPIMNYPNFEHLEARGREKRP